MCMYVCVVFSPSNRALIKNVFDSLNGLIEIQNVKDIVRWRQYKLKVIFIFMICESITMVLFDTKMDKLTE